MKKKLLLIPLMVFMVSSMVGCSNNPGSKEKDPVEPAKVSLTNIVIVPPSKLDYFVGDELDTTGLVVRAIYSDGSVKVIEAKNYTVNGFTSETAGECLVKVSYKEEDVTKEESFKVNIKAKEEFPVYLYQSDSLLYLNTYNEKNVYALRTYRHKLFGEVPYIEFTDILQPYLGFLEYSRNFYELEEGVFILSRTYGSGKATIDVNRQMITLHNAAALFTDAFGLNNGVGDYGAGAKLVKESTKTKVLVEGTDRVINLENYGFKLETKNGKLYMPLSVFNSVFIAPVINGIAYNGHDYFIRQALDHNSVSTIAFSGKAGFAWGSSGTTQRQFYKAVDVKNENEAYRFKADLNTSTLPGKTIDLVLNKDGTGSALSDDNSMMPAIDKSITWTKSGDIITMTVTTMMMGEAISDPSILKIRTDDSSYFAKGTRSEEHAKDTYRELCLTMDLTNGLKEFKGYTTFDEEFTKTGRKEALLSTDIETYQDAIAKFVGTDLDEMHSSLADQSFYGNFAIPAYFSSKLEDDSATGKTGYNGTRQRAFIKSLQTAKKAYDDASRNVFHIQGDTAVMQFDAFSYRENATFKYDAEQYQPEDTLEKTANKYFKFLTNNNVYAAISTGFNEVKKHEEIKNIVFDLSLNLGGEVRLMPLLEAFFNIDPSIIVKNNIDNSIIDLHYEVDLNGDGVYADKDNDTFEGKYNFYILTSGVSFSCGNAFPTIAKNSGKAKIIGELSAGGSCMVAQHATSDGLTFNTSSPYQFQLIDKTNNTYTHNENGVPLDHPLPLADAYDLSKLVTFLSGLNN